MSDGAIGVIGRWRMLASVPVFFKYCFLGLIAAALIIVAFALFIAACAYLKSVICRAVAERSVQIGTFQDLSDSKINHAPYVVPRTNELFQRVPLDALYEVKVPPLKTGFGSNEDLKFLDNVKINIQGVDIPDVIKSVFAILPDDQPVVSAEPDPAAGGSAMRLDWKEPSGEKKSWLLRSDKPPNDPGATRDLIDQAIYKMMYYLYYDPEKHKPSPAGVDFPSERALVAYYSGQQYLGAYQRKLGSAEASTSQKKAGDQPDEPQKQYPDLDEAER